MSRRCVFMPRFVRVTSSVSRSTVAELRANCLCYYRGYGCLCLGMFSLRVLYREMKSIRKPKTTQKGKTFPHPNLKKKSLRSKVSKTDNNRKGKTFPHSKSSKKSLESENSKIDNEKYIYMYIHEIRKPTEFKKRKNHSLLAKGQKTHWIEKENKSRDASLTPLQNIH